MPDLGWDVLAVLGAVAALFVIVTCVIVLVLIVKMVRKFKVVNQPGMPVSAKMSYYGSIIYTVLPFDLLPDPVLLDDICFLVGALVHVSRSAKKIYRGIHSGPASSNLALPPPSGRTRQ